jgi:hypothetical protein
MEKFSLLKVTGTINFRTDDIRQPKRLDWDKRLGGEGHIRPQFLLFLAKVAQRGEGHIRPQFLMFLAKVAQRD